VLAAHFDLLAVDCDWTLRWSPVPHAQRARTAETERVDVLAVHDGPINKMLNVGLMWVRSTGAMRRLVALAENRTSASWDQGIFNVRRAPRALRLLSTLVTLYYGGVRQCAWLLQRRHLASRPPPRSVPHRSL